MDEYTVIAILIFVLLLMASALLWLVDTVFSIPADWKSCRKKTSISVS